jgi:hypothetical protein
MKVYQADLLLYSEFSWKITARQLKYFDVKFRRSLALYADQDLFSPLHPINDDRWHSHIRYVLEDLFVLLHTHIVITGCNDYGESF